MNHDHWTDIEIQEYLEGIPPENAQAKKEHLASCPSCRRQMEQYRVVMSGLVELPAAELSEEFADRVLRQHLPPSRRWGFFPLMAIILSIATFTVIIGYTASHYSIGDLTAELNHYLQPVRSMSWMAQGLAGRVIAWLNGCISWLVWAALLLLATKYFDRALRYIGLPLKH
jgi:anti-sigma factor RsiW